MLLSNIFEEVDSKALVLWKCKRYEITKQFYKRSVVSWPIGIVFEVFNVLLEMILACEAFGAFLFSTLFSFPCGIKLDIFRVH